jgi:histidyl-tRNA synthetase
MYLIPGMRRTKIPRCKGTQDLLPKDMEQFRYIEGIFRSNCLRWGYQEIRTPVLEYLYLFTSAGTLTPGMLSKVYSFLDWDGWSGERVVLRPEGTIPAARLYLEDTKPAKLARFFYIEDVFSFEETGRELRERWQCGVELIGSNKPSANVELISLALEIFQNLGLDKVELKLSHIGLIKALLKNSGVAATEADEILSQILAGEFKSIEANPQLYNSLSLLQLKGKSPGFLKNLASSAEKTSAELESNLNNLIQVAQLLSTTGKEYQIDLTSGRGFEYYTGVVFQFYLEGQRLGGGGRYDDLIPLLGGGKVPACGFALDLDKLMNFIKLREVPPPKVIIQNESDELEGWRNSFEVANSLREVGYIAELEQESMEREGFLWLLRVQSPEKKSLFSVTDVAHHKTIRANSIDEVIKLLRG